MWFLSFQTAKNRQAYQTRKIYFSVQHLPRGYVLLEVPDDKVVVITYDIRVIKSNGNREPFNEEKLRLGLMRALEKRPVSLEGVESVITRIKRALRATGEPEMKSLELGELVMAELRELDKIAYVRFASVYRSFQDIHEFKKEIDSMGEKDDQLPHEGGLDTSNE